MLSRDINILMKHLEFTKESDLNLDEAEIIRCNSSGLNDLQS